MKESGVITSGLSDHFLVYCSRGAVSSSLLSTPIIKRVQSFKNYSKDSLVQHLGMINWSSVLTSTDVNFCLDEFCRLFMLAVDKVAPVRDIRVRQRSEPWMTAHILAGIRERDDVLRQYKRDKSDKVLYARFCRLRNAVQRDIKVAKSSYFRDKIRQNKGDSTKLWDQLKSLGYSKKSSGDSGNIVLNEGDDKVFDPSRVASIFNRFYTT